MTLRETIETINYYAILEPNVNLVINSGDVYDLSKDNYEQLFGAFCLTQETPHLLDGQFWTFNFYMTYTDRLVADKSNKREIQSNAIDTLGSIIKKLNILSMLDIEEENEVTLFTEKFSEECAGGYMRFSVKTPVKSICAIVYEKLGEFAPKEFSDAFFKYIETL